MTQRPQLFVLLACAALFVTFTFAQRFSGSERLAGADDREETIHVTEGGYDPFRGIRFRGVRFDEATTQTARGVASHSTETPMWTNSTGFEKDSFAFCRLRYVSAFYGRRGSVGDWRTDLPDSDLNLSYRLQQMTSMKVDPNGRFLRLQNKDLYDYPWIYMVEPGRLVLDDEDTKILRDYLNNGGFLMADDFWGDLQWENFETEMKKVFPSREFVELQMDHPVFHMVFDLTVPKQQLQTPNWYQAYQSLDPNSGVFGITWEERSNPGAEEMHVRAILDDKGRIMVIATHNCDNGDGWEREGVNDDFFRNFSEKRAFPLGINIIAYAMTH
jgi:hypothetical protein